MAFEAFMVTVAATGAGALDTADPAKAERLISGATPTNAYMVKVWGWGGRENGEEPGRRDDEGGGGGRERRGRVERERRAAVFAEMGGGVGRKGGGRVAAGYGGSNDGETQGGGRRLGGQTRPGAAEGRGPLDQPTPAGRDGRTGALSASWRAPARWAWD